MNICPPLGVMKVNGDREEGDKHHCHNATKWQAQKLAIPLRPLQVMGLYLASFYLQKSIKVRQRFNRLVEIIR